MSGRRLTQTLRYSAMFPEDLQYFCCPRTQERLKVHTVTQQGEDGEILEGELVSEGSGNRYRITNGIPRFVEDTEYNKTWDYKWTAIDRGKGLNYRIIDKSDPAYKIHDIFDRNGHGGEAFRYAAGRLVLDIGCGVGQYTVKLLRDYGPAKVVAVDLTGGVDIFRKIVFERFPAYRKKIVFVQANVFAMPFRPQTFDYVFSLGVLHHTGRTREAILAAADLVKEGGQMNVWVYAPAIIHYDVREQNRPKHYTLITFIPFQLYSIWVLAQITLFRRLPHRWVVRILAAFSSQLWYSLCKLPVVGIAFRAFFGTVMHPDRDYRFINNYDGWCNSWADTWSEQELFPTIKQAGLVIRGISSWPTGLWCVKQPEFYRR